jgi:chromosome segregation ATPase
MAKPLSPSDPRGGMNGGGTGGAPYQPRYTLDDSPQEPTAVSPELEALQAENEQLRALCAELEQALHEATQQPALAGTAEEQLRSYEALLEEKNDTIRELHQQLADLTAAFEDHQREKEVAAPRRSQAPMPREDDLLALSEELERERRQLQEDEHSLMEQMRQMEVGMARERAEMARQRNDLQRLFGEIRHELERLERGGALASKIEGLKTRLQDATNRRGAAPAAPNSGGTPAQQAPPPEQAAPQKGASVLGRLFGGNKQAPK